MEYHVPVMLNESLEYLNIKKDGLYLDLTMGGGGHSKAILEKLTNGRLVSVDQDEDAHERAKRIFSGYDNFYRYKFNFGDEKLWELLEKEFGKFDGILMDLGVSSHQLDEAERGFSFMKDAPLDMRMGKENNLTAEEVVNTFSEKELADIIYKYGEERKSRRIAKKICENRPILTTKELSEVVESCFNGYERRKMKKHPATRTFQALRIYVNGEIEVLEKGLDFAIDALAKKGRMVVISYHSLEDRVVKEKFVLESKNCICPPEQMICTCNHKAKIKRITKKVVKPTEDEIARNPRSRSAKMRVAEKL